MNQKDRPFASGTLAGLPLEVTVLCVDPGVSRFRSDPLPVSVASEMASTGEQPGKNRR